LKTGGCGGGPAGAEHERSRQQEEHGNRQIFTHFFSPLDFYVNGILSSHV
jgi:hypothetical protein